MRNHERHIYALFQAFAFLVIFCLRISIAAIQLAIYVFRSVRDSENLEIEPIVEIAEPINEALRSRQCRAALRTVSRTVRIVAIYLSRMVVWTAQNSPRYFQLLRAALEHLLARFQRHEPSSGVFLALPSSIER